MPFRTIIEGVRPTSLVFLSVIQLFRQKLTIINHLNLTTMIKRTLLFLMTVTMVFGAMTTAEAQDNSKYEMWESIMMTPDYTKLKVLGENMRKHNQKYHKEGAYEATVYNIATGPNAGKLIWEMGPLMFAHLDKRPSAGGHDEDWRDNVMPYIKKMHTAEYWKDEAKYSNTGMLDGDNSKYPLLYVRYWEVNPDQDHLVDGLLKQISETFKGMEGDNPWGVYDNQMRQGLKIGRHLATVGFMKNWAEMDDPGTFKPTFIKVHGEDAWDPFLENMGNAFTNSWDEVWEYNANLSGK